MNTDHQNNATQVTPIDQMLQMMSGFWISRGIYIAAKLGLADYLRDGAKTAAELRASCRPLRTSASSKPSPRK